MPDDTRVSCKLLQITLYLRIRIFVVMKYLQGFVLFVSFLFVSCGNQEIKHTLSEVERCICEHPDNALETLRGMDQSSLNTKKLRARFALLYAIALDKNYIDTTDVSVIMPAVNYYKRHGSPDEKLKTHFYLGRIYLNAHRFEKAAYEYALAESEAEKSQDLVQKGLLFMNFSYLYNWIHNNDKQLEYAEKGLACYREAGDSSRMNLSYGDLARAYHGMREWDKADSLYHVGIEKMRHDTLVVSNLLSNYAKMKTIQSEPDPHGAISLLESLSQKYHQPLSIIDYGVYAYASDMIGNQATCDRIATQLENLDAKHKKDALIWLYRIYNRRGDYKKALDYLQSAKVYNIDMLDSLLALPVSEGIQDYYRSVADENRVRSHRIVIISAGSLSFAVLLFMILLLYHRVRLMKERENDRQMLRLLDETKRVLEQENAELKSKYDKSEEERGKARLSLASVYKGKFATMGELCKIYLGLNDRSDKKEVIYYRVEQIISEINGDNNLFDKFESRINQDLNGILVHMKKDLGIADKKDERFICYLIAGLDSQTIAMLLNLSVPNVYTKRSRLRERIRKLNSPYKDDYLLVI